MFELFSIGELWTDQPYARYVYRALGAFVVMAGIVALVLASNPERYRTIIKAFSLSFLTIGVVMTVSGLSLGLPLCYFLPDPFYCFVVAALFLTISR